MPSTTHEQPQEEVKVEVDDKENALQEFLKTEKLLLLKMLDQNSALVNYANTPVDTTIIYKDGKWQYK